MSRHMLRIPVTGPLELVEVPTFREMAQVIGADYIERVRVGPEWAIAVDDSGLLLRKPINLRASRLYGGPIAGDALLGVEGFVGDGVDWLDTDETQAVGFLAEREAVVT